MNGKKIGAAAIMLMIFTFTAGVTSAYLTDVTEKLDNMITPGSISVELTETKWISEKAGQLVPKSSVEKNPAVTNTGKNDAWIFLKVQIPMKEICVVDSETKKKGEKKKTELFSFRAEETWELLNKEETEEYQVYLYGYRTIVEPQESTTELFEQVHLVNYLEGELDENDELLIPVEAMAIQTNVCAADASLYEVYQQYISSISDGR